MRHNGDESSRWPRATPYREHSETPIETHAERASARGRLAESGFPLGRCGRWLLALWLLLLVAGFGLAACLEPAPQGFGTHRQLGLPPCTFQTVYDIPCPSCGMTTSFSHFVRAEFIHAARTNAAGLILAGVCALQIPWGIYSVWKQRLWLVSRPDAMLVALLIGLCAASVLNWLVQLSLQ